MSWIVATPSFPPGRERLFCFPFAGGGAAVFRSWQRQLEGVAVCPVQRPGRGARMAEEPCFRLPQLAVSACDALRPAMVPPFALFGHSFGALLAFEIARELRRRGAPGPDHLFVSGRRAPRLPEPAPPLHGLPDAEFVAEIRHRFDGIPPAILQEPELLRLLLPVLRADMAALETYEYREEEPLACPISAFGGEDDPWATHDELEAWRGETSASFVVRRFAGGHFYLQQAEPLLLPVLAERLAEATTAATVKTAP